MFRLKNWIKNLFGFTRAQVNGSLVLLIIMAIALFSEPLWRWWVRRQPTDFSADAVLLDSLIAHWPLGPVPIIPDTAKEPRKRFKFNPNLASMEELVSLGFSQSMAQRVIRYREKGGNFRAKSDLLKIYGFDSSFYNQLVHLIELPNKSPAHVRPQENHKTAAAKKKAEVSAITRSFDINTADTAQLKEIRGIGDKLSLRIVKYRDVLGGFTSLEQLREVYGLDSAVINRLQSQTYIDGDFRPVQIDLNTSSEADILKHPYLSKSARSIVSYRFQHGPFAKVEDIRNIGSLDDEQAKKIMPYITVK